MYRHTLQKTYDAVFLEDGLIAGASARYRSGPLRLEKFFPGIYGIDRCATGAAMGALPRDSATQRYFRQVAHGLDVPTLAKIQIENDKYLGETKWQRRHRMLRWLEMQLWATKKDSDQLAKSPRWDYAPSGDIICKPQLPSAAVGYLEPQFA